MSGFSVASRLARREAVRRPWRSLLVLLLVLIPVVALTAIVVLTRTGDQTWAEEFADTAGAEDLRVDLPRTDDEGILGGSDAPPLPSTQLLDLLPDGSHSVEIGLATDRIRTHDRNRAWGAITDRPLDDPISDGLIRRLDGRLPRTSDEVLLTARLARELGVGLGDPLVLDRPGEYASTVVGIAEWGNRVDHSVMVIGTADDPAALSANFDDVARRMLIDLPAGYEPDGAFTQALIAAEATTPWLPQEYYWTPTTQTTIVWTWIGGAVVFIILGVVITAAFAVTARRQLTLLGQLMANGSDERTLRLTLVLQGTIIGIAGGLAGIAIALVGIQALQPLVEEHLLSRRIESFDIRFADIAPVALIAVAAATGSALLPARSAVRTPTLQALAGRRPVGPYPARLVARGAMAAVAGLALLAVATAGTVGRDGHQGGASLLALTGIAGALALILGTCAMTPAIIARLEPLAGSLRGTARLAARSIARQRVRTGAVVAAIAVVAAGAVAGSSAFLTAEARESNYTHSQAEDLVVLHFQEWTDEQRGDEIWSIATTLEIPPEAVDEVLTVIPEGRVLATQVGRLSTANYDMVQIVDDEIVAALDLPSDASKALADGAVISFGWWVEDGPVTSPVEQEYPLHFDATEEGGTMRVVLLPQHPGMDQFMGSMFATAETAVGVGYELAPGPVIVQSPSPLTADQRDAMSDVAVDLSYDHSSSSEAAGTSSWMQVNYPYETFEASRAVVTAAIVGGATVLVLAVVALGLALSAAETRDERDVLAAIGAPPRALRRLAASKAAVLAGTGTLIGIPLGFIPVAVMVQAAASNSFTTYAAVFPWVQVGLIIVVVPLVASAAALGASGLALRLRPVTASSMAFD